MLLKISFKLGNVFHFAGSYFFKHVPRPTGLVLDNKFTVVVINYQNPNPKLKVPTHSPRSSRRQCVSLKSASLFTKRRPLCNASNG